MKKVINTMLTVERLEHETQGRVYDLSFQADVDGIAPFALEYDEDGEVVGVKVRMSAPTALKVVQEIWNDRLGVMVSGPAQEV